MSADILLILVNYGTPGQVIDFCKRVRAQEGGDSVALLVADNSASFGTAESETEWTPKLRATGADLYRSGDNLGYFGGARAALEAYRASEALPDYVIIANSDILFLNDNFFVRLRRMTLESDVLGIAPDILRAPTLAEADDTAYRENPMRKERMSRRSIHLRTLIYQSRLLTMAHYSRSWLVRRISRKPLARVEAGPIYMMHGSFMIFLRAYFERCAGFDFPSFLFGEEIFVAEEILEAGGKIILNPELRLLHIGGATTLEIPSKRRSRYELASFQMLLRRYFRR